MSDSKRTSHIIAEIVDDFDDHSTMTVADFLAKMGNRAHAMAILVFSISTVVAGVVPGFSTLTAVPILFIALQMAVGKTSIWLPKKIRVKKIPPGVVRGALAQSVPTLRLLEKFLRPRLIILTHPIMSRIIALVMVVLAMVLSLPIPGGNFLPSMGISILALSLLERDGLFVLAAMALVFLTGGVMIDLIIQAFQYLEQAIF